jgi:uncharacterized protein YyaL (SSP411 family)
MMEESFEDAEVAAILNREFLPVKVDREERPDVDAVYMRACQAMTGSGGWPLTAFLTADQTPFYAGTYFPKHNVRGRIGLTELMTAVAAAWKTDRASLLSSGRALEEALREECAPSSADAKSLPTRAFEQLRRAFDSAWGGFGHAPKFPTPSTLLFLLRYYALEGAPEARAMAEETLSHMARGGMFDHLGGGFCRYSTDRKWLIPHFEKMLYDNALLLYAYAQAYRITRREEYREVAEKIVTYLAREMRAPEGGFYAAQDADSEGREGAYYAFTPEDAVRVLGGELGERFNRAFGITESGNFEGASVPNRIHSKDPLNDELRRAASRMADYRRGRVRLATDDKQMAGWNALAIGALASASRALGRSDILDLALDAKRFMAERLMEPDGLRAYYRDGRAAGKAHLDDYAALAWANLELYEATLNQRLIPETEALLGGMIERLYDPDQGDFFLGEAGGDLKFRSKEHMDGAALSGNSLAADAFLRLHAITGNVKWRELMDRLLAAIGNHAEDYPSGCCYGLLVMLRARRPMLRAACLTGEAAQLEDFLSRAGRLYLKNAVLAADAPEPAGTTSYHLCEGEACGAPILSGEALGRALAAYACGATE